MVTDSGLLGGVESYLVSDIDGGRIKLGDNDLTTVMDVMMKNVLDDDEALSSDEFSSVRTGHTTSKLF